MKLLHGSVVDTAVAFIAKYKKKKVDSESISSQMKTMTFKQQMDLVDAMKEEDVKRFDELIQVDVEESAGQSIGVIQNKPNNDYSAMIKKQTRDASTGRGQPDTVVRGGTGAVAGKINTAPTGKPSAPPAQDIQGQNAQTAAQAAQQAGQNAEQLGALAGEIDRLKQLAMGKR